MLHPKTNGSITIFTVYSSEQLNCNERLEHIDTRIIIILRVFEGKYNSYQYSSIYHFPIDSALFFHMYLNSKLKDAVKLKLTLWHGLHNRHFLGLVFVCVCVSSICEFVHVFVQLAELSSTTQQQTQKI